MGITQAYLDWVKELEKRCLADADDRYLFLKGVGIGLLESVPDALACLGLQSLVIGGLVWINKKFGKEED